LEKIFRRFLMYVLLIYLYHIYTLCPYLGETRNICYMKYFQYAIPGHRYRKRVILFPANIRVFFKHRFCFQHEMY
jgi:hypothetical protein